ncbi:MAG: putative Ig domain-containing protein [Deltaproteobacteria bacterium]|nr:putative Ig domain-containing protein [Deltaproteobacteria bacterium]
MAFGEAGCGALLALTPGMRIDPRFLVLLPFLATPLEAWALPNLSSESGFTYDFQATAQGTLLNGSSDAYDGCYRLTVDGTTFDADGQPYEDYYDGRGFRTAEVTIGDLAVRRHGFVPEHGLSFARYVDSVRNDGDEEATVTIAYYCNLGSDGNETIDSSDSDPVMELTDTWVSTDDDDGARDPSLAHVLRQDGASVELASIEYSRGVVEWSYEVSIPAGATASIMIFAVQEQTRALARAAAESLAALGEEALEGIGDEIADVGNFAIGPEGAPVLRAHGPYSVEEGGAVRLGIEVLDSEGDEVSWSWDLDGDGEYGELANRPDPLIDASDADGPSALRVGIEMTDGSSTVTRTISIGVDNVAPTIGSEPPASATTGEQYEYTVVASDIAADTLSFEVVDGPPLMTVSPEGIVRWRPEADGRGPLVPVTLRVSDDDGGAAEQSWTIGMAGAPTVQVGGPYRVAEGGTIELAPMIEDAEGDALTFAWDLDGDGDNDDGDEPTATFWARDVDGPGTAQAELVIYDGTHITIVQIPIVIQNSPPVFASVPATTAVVDRPWSYTIQATDPGSDQIEISVDEDELPSGMTFDRAALVLTWIPGEEARFEGNPPGQYAFTITAEDDDGGRERQEVAIGIGTNAPPPVPPIKYPAGDEPVRVPNPTILFDKVEDPDGDTLTYLAELDTDPCFCSLERQASGPLAEGELAIEWAVPFPLQVNPATGTQRFYLRRWANDGLQDSEKQLSLFDVELWADPEADGGTEGEDADGGTGVAGGDETASCACRMPGGPTGHMARSHRPSPSVWFACLAILLAALRARRASLRREANGRSRCRAGGRLG